MAASYSVLASLNWLDTTDYDLYARVNSGSTIYYGQKVNDGLRLNWDAYPNCMGDGITDSPPEIISSDVDYDIENTFYFWYSRFSDICGGGGAATTSVTIINTGDVDISVNGNLLTPGANFVGDIEFVPVLDGQAEYGGGTKYVVSFSTELCCTLPPPDPLPTGPPAFTLPTTVMSSSDNPIYNASPAVYPLQKVSITTTTTTTTPPPPITTQSPIISTTLSSNVCQNRCWNGLNF